MFDFDFDDLEELSKVKITVTTLDGKHMEVVKAESCTVKEVKESLEDSKESRKRKKDEKEVKKCEEIRVNMSINRVLRSSMASQVSNNAFVVAVTSSRTEA